MGHLTLLNPYPYARYPMHAKPQHGPPIGPKMNNPNQQRWFAIRTLTGHETKASGELTHAGIEVWCPTFRTLTKPTKKRKPVEVNRPLLPGYTLAIVDPGAWGAVRACKSVIGWVSGQNGPLPCLRPAEINSMRERERLGAFDHTGLEGRLSKGDPLEILFGPCPRLRS